MALYICGFGALLFAQTQRLDVAVLRDTGRFEDVRVSKEKGKMGGIVLRFAVVERRPIQ